MTGQPSTIVLIADHSMETFSRIVSVLRARRFRVASFKLEPSGATDLAAVTIVLDGSSGDVRRAAAYLRRIEEVHEVHIPEDVAR